MNDENENDNDNKKFLETHAWKYFQLHANQRMMLIRFYLLIFSLYITAAGYLIIKINRLSSLEEGALMAISVAFILLTIIFFFLDRRNRNLIHLAENSLRKLEEKYLSKDEEGVHQIFINEKKSAACCCSPRHTRCFEALFALCVFMAIVIFIYSWFHLYKNDSDQLGLINCTTQCGILYQNYLN